MFNAFLLGGGGGYFMSMVIKKAYLLLRSNNTYNEDHTLPGLLQANKIIKILT